MKTFLAIINFAAIAVTCYQMYVALFTCTNEHSFEINFLLLIILILVCCILFMAYVLEEKHEKANEAKKIAGELRTMLQRFEDYSRLKN